MNIDKDLLDNDMNLDDDILYNFMDASSQLMRDNGLTPWRGLQEKQSLFIQVLIDGLSKLEGIVADLIAYTYINSFVFTLIFIFNIITTIMYYLFDRTFHTCLPHF